MGSSSKEVIWDAEIEPPDEFGLIAMYVDDPVTVVPDPLGDPIFRTAYPGAKLTVPPTLLKKEREVIPEGNE